MSTGLDILHPVTIVPMGAASIGSGDGKPIIVNLNYMQDTAPSNPQEKETWYNTSDNKIYTYKNGSWGTGTEPSVGVFYLYNDQYYLWDGDSLEETDLNIYEKIANKKDDYTLNSSIYYPSSKALHDGLESIKNTLNVFDNTTGSTLDTQLELGNTVLVFKNGQQLYAGLDRDFVINGSVITFTEPLVNTDVIGVINGNLAGIQMATVATSGDYNDLINKPVMSFEQAGITETSSTFVALANQIQSKSLQTGTILYGEVTNTPMPSGVGNAEVKVEILDTKTTVNPQTGYNYQVLQFTLSSSDVEPYVWTFVYYEPNYINNSQTWTWSSGGGSSNLSFTNVSASNWVSDNTYSDYGYKCELTCNGVTADDYATVLFSSTDVNSGNYASFCETGTNTVTIYSKVNTTTTIPKVVIIR